MWPFRRKSEDRTLSRESLPGILFSGQANAPNGGYVTPERATFIPDAYACIRALSDAAASLPLHVYRRTQAGRVRVERGPTVDLLQNPAPAVAQGALVGQIMASLQGHGNTYVGLYSAGGEIVQIGCLNPDQVTVEIKRGEPVYTYIRPDGDMLDLTRDDVVHIRAAATAPDGFMGLSPVRQARLALSLSDSMSGYSAGFFDNSAMPLGILKVQKYGAQTTEIDEIKTAFEARHKSGPAVDGMRPQNAHRLAVIEGEVDFMPLSLNPDDVQFFESRKLSSVEVARVFRVPPHMIGADSGESMTYENVESVAIEFATFALRPWLVLIEQALSASRLFPPGHFCEFDLSALLRADHATRATFYTAALDPITGWMQRHEVRERENLPPEQGPPAPAAELAAIERVEVHANGNGQVAA